MLSLAIVVLPAAGAEAASCQPNCPKPFLPNNQVQTTTPANGDVNPYGVAFVPNGFPTTGVLAPGDLLISNFNNKNNLQGTGTSIIHYIPGGGIQPPGNATLFTTTGPGPGLAFGIVRAGFVLSGQTGTTDGMFGTIKSGGLVFYDTNGNVKFTQNGNGVNAPWGLAINDNSSPFGGVANIFVSNLNPVAGATTAMPTGTVTRLDVQFRSIRGGPVGITVFGVTTLATGYTVEPNQGALVLGPAGLAYDAANDILYVASQADNAIFAIHPARTATTAVNRGTLIVQNGQLRAPTGLMLGPNGDLLTANNDAVNPDPMHPSEIVEYTPTGQLVRQMNVDQAIAGAFGLNFGTGFGPNGNQLRFGFVDDNTVTLTVYTCPAAGC